MLDSETPLTPDWWLLRLGRRLRDREPWLTWWWRYYTGDQPLPQAPRKVSQAYLDFQKKARTNFCAMPVSAGVHRMQAIGVTDGAGESMDLPWRWWQANKLDARQKAVYRTALSQSVAYVMVGKHPRRTMPDGSARPLVTPEHPRECIVEHDPSTGERIAGLKAWYDSVNREGRATVFLPDQIVEYTTGSHAPGARLPWGPTNWERNVEQTNTYGQVPLVPFPCQPELGQDPEPEFGRVMGIQDRINLSTLNRMTAERYSAFRQKYVSGHKFRKSTDPATGLETVEQPFVPDPGSVWASEGENTKFGEFSQTDLMGYLKTAEQDIRTMFVLTSTPAYYMPGDLVNISTDTITALDTNHVARVSEHLATFGEAWEEVLELCGIVAGSDEDFSSAEVRWEDPRQLNPAVIADMGSKKRSMGYPLPMVAEDMGESPARVDRLRTEAAAEQLLAPQSNTGESPEVP